MNELMEYLGVVLEIKENKAYLITDSCEVVCIKKQPGMYEGMEVAFDSSEIVKNANSYVRYSAVIASVAAVFIAIMLYVNVFNSNQIYAYVDVDINTSWELVVDKNNRVIDVKVNDSDYKFLIEDLNFKSKPLENVLVDLVEKMNQKGLIDLKSRNKALITACLQEKGGKQVDKIGFKNLEQSYSKIKEELLSRNIEPFFLEVKEEDRKLAADNNISMGRYSIYKIGKEQGMELDLEKLKKNQINDILEKVDIDRKLNENTGNSGAVNPNPTNTENNTGSNGSEPYIGEDLDLSIGDIDDIEIIKSIEAANIETQKVIQEIQQQVNKDIAVETEKANNEISKIRNDPKLSNDQKNSKIKQIEMDLIKKIDEIKKNGNEKAQAELVKLEKKVKDMLPKIN